MRVMVIGVGIVWQVRVLAMSILAATVVVLVVVGVVSAEISLERHVVVAVVVRERYKGPTDKGT